MPCPAPTLSALTAINGQDNKFGLTLTADSGLTGKGIVIAIKRSVLDADDAVTTVVLGTSPRSGVVIASQSDTAIAATLTITAANTATLGLSANTVYGTYQYSVSVLDGSTLYPVGDGVLVLQRVAVGSGVI